MYSTKTFDNAHIVFNSWNQHDDFTKLNDFGLDLIIDCFFNGDTPNNNMYPTFVKDYLSRAPVTTVKKIFDNYEFSPEKHVFSNSFCRAIKQCKDNNCELIEYLTKIKYDEKFVELRNLNQTLKKNNTVLTLNNKSLEKENEKLKKQLQNTSYFQLIPNLSLLMVIFALIWYNFM